VCLPVPEVGTHLGPQARVQLMLIRCCSFKDHFFGCGSNTSFLFLSLCFLVLQLGSRGKKTGHLS
jgi:hypothetical protein